jgi:hypothetical protein
MSVLSRRTFLHAALSLVAAFGCARSPSRFVIISDLHPYPSGYEQLDALTAHVIELRPAFVVLLGDIGGDEVPGVSEKEIDAIRGSFSRMRTAGIEIYPAMGNHDVHPRVQGIKVGWLLGQTPMPLNPLFEASRQSPAYQVFQAHGPYDYSFNRGGIHFAIIDSNVMPPRDPGQLSTTDSSQQKALADKPPVAPNPPVVSGEHSSQEQARWERHRQWMKDDLCHHANNPQRFPTLVFMHHPQYMTGDRKMEVRPLYRVLDECRDEQTVKAIFGGDWHMGGSFPAEKNLGIQVYATQASVHPAARPVQFIVAEIGRDGLTLESRDSMTGKPSTGPVKYLPIPGRFMDMKQ